MAKISYLHDRLNKSDGRYKFLEQLVRKYDPELRNYLMKMLGNQDDAAEVAQEAYLKLYRLSNPEQVEYPKALLFRSASNLAIDRLRKAANQAFHSDEGLDALVDEASNLEKVAVSHQALDHLLHIINELPQRRRQVLVMKKFSELSHQEISKSLGITKSMVEQHMTRALKHCRQRLKELGLR